MPTGKDRRTPAARTLSLNPSGVIGRYFAEQMGLFHQHKHDLLRRCTESVRVRAFRNSRVCVWASLILPVYAFEGFGFGVILHTTTKL